MNKVERTAAAVRRQNHEEAFQFFSLSKRLLKAVSRENEQIRKVNLNNNNYNITTTGL